MTNGKLITARPKSYPCVHPQRQCKVRHFTSDVGEMGTMTKMLLGSLAEQGKGSSSCKPDRHLLILRELSHVGEREDGFL